MKIETAKSILLLMAGIFFFILCWNIFKTGGAVFPRVETLKNQTMQLQQDLIQLRQDFDNRPIHFRIK